VCIHENQISFQQPQNAWKRTDKMYTHEMVKLKFQSKLPQFVFNGFMLSCMKDAKTLKHVRGEACKQDNFYSTLKFSKIMSQAYLKQNSI
jgi:hypothetical protein